MGVADPDPSGLPARNGTSTSAPNEPTVENEPPARNGLVAVKSAFSVKETLDRLAYRVEAKGLIVFCRIDQRRMRWPPASSCAPLKC